MRANFSLPLLNAASGLMVAFILSPEALCAQPGEPIWTNRYNGPWNEHDFASAVAVDGGGNVFVTGRSKGDGLYEDYATVAYSSGGVALWTNRYDGPGSQTDRALALATDSSGDVFVTGSSTGFSGLTDYVTIRYSNTGVPLWTRRYSPSDSVGGGSAVAVAVDSDTVFVTGYGSRSGRGYDYLTIAYSKAGALLWTNSYNGPQKSHDEVRSLAIDNNGNVFVTGYSYGSGSSADYATIAYSKGGSPLWTNRYNGPGNGYDAPHATAVDFTGNLLVTGVSRGIGGDDDYATVKYSNAGIPLWTNRYNGPGNGQDAAYAIAVDSGGNVFVTGFSLGSDNVSGYATIAYSGAGIPLWTNRYDPGHAFGVAVDSGGNVFVTGKSRTSGGSFDYATIAYSGAGVPLWTNRYRASANGNHLAVAVAVDSSGSVLVTGHSTSNSYYSDYATIKYSAFGPMPIPLNSRIAGNQIVLSWTNAAFSLQSAPDVSGAFTNISGATSPHTNLILGGQQFFRLKGN